jgi:hypothetical protein
LLAATWRELQKFDVQMEVSRYHHNVAGNLLSLRPVIYLSWRGHGEVSKLEIHGTLKA